MEVSNDYSFSLTLPEWAITENKKLKPTYETIEDRMREVLRFARRNTKEQTGGLSLLVYLNSIRVDR